VKFYYGDCGQPHATDGTPGDLLAEQLRRITLDFCADLKHAVTNGPGYRHSGCMLNLLTQDAIDAVGHAPTPETIATACDSLAALVAWRCDNP
jgi:hypothetical protein